MRLRDEANLTRMHYFINVSQTNRLAWKEALFLDRLLKCIFVDGLSPIKCTFPSARKCKWTNRRMKIRFNLKPKWKVGKCNYSSARTIASPRFAGMLSEGRIPLKRKKVPHRHRKWIWGCPNVNKVIIFFLLFVSFFPFHPWAIGYETKERTKSV